MNNATRLQYLDAMGIDVWILRNRGQTEVLYAFDEQSARDIETTVNPAGLISEKWSALEKQVAECKSCELCNSRTQTVFGSGNIHADWMFIGEAPRQNEDSEGKPFVGQTGELLTEMIRAIGLSKESVYIANILKCRPPNDREPRLDEVNTCNQFLQEQIALVKPKIILAVGRVAAQALLKTNEPLSKLRGVCHQLNSIPLVVVYHPAYLLRSLLEKRKAWQDLQLANKIYKEKII